MSFCSKLGFFNADDFSNFSLKWTPCFFNSKKRANFLVDPGGGDPGGESGMLKLGTGGMVRLRRVMRFEVYGDAGLDSEPSVDCSTSAEGITGPSAGPDGGGASFDSD